MISILVTTPNENLAKQISLKLIESRLSNHIVHIPGIKSYIHRNNQVVERTESQLQIQTKALLYSDIEKEILDLAKSEEVSIYSVPITQIALGYYEKLKDGVIKV
jgi:uncharacterized protein involved in tolerance to divalent cations